MWTYQNGKNRHQLDHIILSRSFISCDVLSDVDIGSDHRPVQVKFSISSIKKKQTRTGSGAKKFTADPTKYDISLQSSMHNYHPTDTDTEEQDVFLEKVMLQAADDAAVRKPASKALGRTGTIKTVETLIAKRREIKGIPDLIAAERKQMRNSISKQIQKETKRALGRRRQNQIEQILLEFRGLKEYSIMHNSKKGVHTLLMEEEHGHKHSDQAGIDEDFSRKRS